MATSFERFIVKRYQHWTLFLNATGQYYLGRSYAWLNREGSMQRLSQLQALERAELFSRVLPEFEAAVDCVWKPDHMNYAWLGNEFEHHNGHGHMHLIPRYEQPREFGGRTYTDSRWGSNYVPYPKRELPEEEVLTILEVLRAGMR